MTIREAGKGIVTTVGGTYRIGFIVADFMSCHQTALMSCL